MASGSNWARTHKSSGGGCYALGAGNTMAQANHTDAQPGAAGARESGEGSLAQLEVGGGSTRAQDWSQLQHVLPPPKLL